MLLICGLPLFFGAHNLKHFDNLKIITIIVIIMIIIILTSFPSWCYSSVASLSSSWSSPLASTRDRVHSRFPSLFLATIFITVICLNYWLPSSSSPWTSILKSWTTTTTTILLGISANDSSGWRTWFVSRYCRRILCFLLHRRHKVSIEESSLKTDSHCKENHDNNENNHNYHHQLVNMVPSSIFGPIGTSLD